MSPNRMHAQAYCPAPGRRVNLIRRVLRAITRSLT
jgi:hypothetical protein